LSKRGKDFRLALTWDLYFSTLEKFLVNSTESTVLRLTPPGSPNVLKVTISFDMRINRNAACKGKLAASFDAFPVAIFNSAVINAPTSRASARS
jgi:hypothetical protein